MALVPPRQAVGSQYLRDKRGIPGIAGADADQPEIDVLGGMKRGLEAILPSPPQGGFKREEYDPSLAAPRQPMAPPTPPAPTAPPSAGKLRADADAVAAAKALETYDQRKNPSAAPPGQGDDGTREPAFGKFGHVSVLSAAPDPATRPGGFAFRRPMGETEASTQYGPRTVGGGHAWTLRTPSSQEQRYDAARYSRETKARQAAEGADIARLDAEAAAAAASIARSRELEQQPFAPEQAAVAGRVTAERAKAAPVQSRQMAAATLLQDYLGDVDEVDQLEQGGKIDAPTASKMRDEAERRYHNGLLAFVPGFRLPKADPFALPPEEAATPAE